MPPRTSSIAMCVTFALLSGGYAGNAAAQIEKVTVKVDGLACPFCVKGIEKHLKKVDGVQQVSTSLKKGEVHLRYRDSAQFDLSSIEEAIEDGGFTPGATTLTAVGVVPKNGETFEFTTKGAENTFLLHEPHAEKLPQGKTLKQATVAKLREVATSKAKVRITGRVHSHKETLPGLSVDELNTIADE